MQFNELIKDNFQFFQDPLMLKVFQFLFVLFLILLLSSYFKKLLIKKIKDSTARYRSRKMVSFISLVLIVLIGFFTFNENLEEFAVTFGIIGAGIAFALKETLSSFFAWFVIAFGNTYKTGDRILIDDILGDVIDINFQNTTLMECGSWVDGDLYNGRIVRVSNRAIFDNPVFNYNKDFPFLWDELKVPVKYGSNIELARKILDEVVNDLLSEYSNSAKKSWKVITRRYLIENAQVDPLVTLTADENWVSFTIRYVTLYTKRRSTKDQLYSTILERFAAEENLEIASTAFEISYLPEIDLGKK